MPLSRRSREIRRLVVEEGYSCNVVARQFGISAPRVWAIATDRGKNGLRQLRQNPPPDDRPGGDSTMKVP
jgi:transposase-like protein